MDGGLEDDEMEGAMRERSNTWHGSRVSYLEVSCNFDVINERTVGEDGSKDKDLDTTSIVKHPHPSSPLVLIPTAVRKNSSRKNAWGSASYADLITEAIESTSDQRMTLNQIYDWMVNNIPYFQELSGGVASMGWKNSIRHNLSLHQQFCRVPKEGAGKSSWWVVNKDLLKVKPPRRRATMGEPLLLNKKRQKVNRKLKMPGSMEKEEEEEEGEGEVKRKHRTLSEMGGDDVTRSSSFSMMVAGKDGAIDIKKIYLQSKSSPIFNNNVTSTSSSSFVVCSSIPIASSTFLLPLTFTQPNLQHQQSTQQQHQQSTQQQQHQQSTQQQHQQSTQQQHQQSTQQQQQQSTQQQQHQQSTQQQHQKSTQQHQTLKTTLFNNNECNNNNNNQPIILCLPTNINTPLFNQLLLSDSSDQSNLKSCQQQQQQFILPQPFEQQKQISFLNNNLLSELNTQTLNMTLLDQPFSTTQSSTSNIQQITNDNNILQQQQTTNNTLQQQQQITNNTLQQQLNNTFNLSEKRQQSLLELLHSPKFCQIRRENPALNRRIIDMLHKKKQLLNKNNINNNNNNNNNSNNNNNNNNNNSNNNNLVSRNIDDVFYVSQQQSPQLILSSSLQQQTTLSSSLQQQTTLSTQQQQTTLSTLQQQTTLSTLQQQTTLSTLQQQTTLSTLQQQTTLSTLQQQTTLSTQQTTLSTLQQHIHKPLSLKPQQFQALSLKPQQNLQKQQQIIQQQQNKQQQQSTLSSPLLQHLSSTRMEEGMNDVEDEKEVLLFKSIDDNKEKETPFDLDYFLQYEESQQLSPSQKQQNQQQQNQQQQNQQQQNQQQQNQQQQNQQQLNFINEMVLNNEKNVLNNINLNHNKNNHDNKLTNGNDMKCNKTNTDNISFCNINSINKKNLLTNILNDVSLMTSMDDSALFNLELFDCFLDDENTINNNNNNNNNIKNIDDSNIGNNN